MSRSIAPTTCTNNARHPNGGPRGGAHDGRSADRELQAAIERIDAIALRLAGGIGELLFDELEEILGVAADRRWSDADLARAIARASARSARLTVFLVAEAPPKNAFGRVAAAVRAVLRHPLRNHSGRNAATDRLAGSQP